MIPHHASIGKSNSWRRSIIPRSRMPNARPRNPDFFSDNLSWSKAAPLQEQETRLRQQFLPNECRALCQPNIGLTTTRADFDATSQSIHDHQCSFPKTLTASSQASSLGSQIQHRCHIFFSSRMIRHQLMPSRPRAILFRNSTQPGCFAIRLYNKVREKKTAKPIPEDPPAESHAN